jgi:hypothetical protein
VPRAKNRRLARIHIETGLEVIDAEEDYEARIPKRAALNGTAGDKHVCIQALTLRYRPDIINRDKEYGPGVEVGKTQTLVRFVNNPTQWVRFFNSYHGANAIAQIDTNGKIKEAAEWIAGNTITLLAVPRSKRIGWRKTKTGPRRGKSTKPPSKRHLRTKVVYVTD